jgi:hypothetical protein
MDDEHTVAAHSEVNQVVGDVFGETHGGLQGFI